MNALKQLHRVVRSPQFHLSFNLLHAIEHVKHMHSDNKMCIKIIDRREKLFRKRFNLNNDQFNRLLAGDPGILVKTYKHYIKWCEKHFQHN